jgi:hypothetical protein
VAELRAHHARGCGVRRKGWDLWNGWADRACGVRRSRDSDHRAEQARSLGFVGVDLLGANLSLVCKRIEMPRRAQRERSQARLLARLLRDCKRRALRLALDPLELERARRELRLEERRPLEQLGVLGSQSLWCRRGRTG